MVLEKGSSYTKIENVFQKPALDALIEIAQHLDLPLDYIVFRNNRPKDIGNASASNAILKSVDDEKFLRASKFLSQITNISSSC